jgi:hypothetical protein
MNTAKKIYEADPQGVVHVDFPTGKPGRRVEVLVVWEDASEGQEDSPNEDWSDLFGLLQDTPIQRGSQGAFEERDTLK